MYAIYHGILNGMKTLVPMDKAGRLVLPKAIREKLCMPGEGLFQVEVCGQRVELEPVASESSGLKRVGRFLVLKGKGRKVDAVAALEATRRDRE